MKFLDELMWVCDTYDETGVVLSTTGVRALLLEIAETTPEQRTALAEKAKTTGIAAARAKLTEVDLELLGLK